MSCREPSSARTALPIFLLRRGERGSWPEPQKRPLCLLAAPNTGIKGLGPQEPSTLHPQPARSWAASGNKGLGVLSRGLWGPTEAVLSPWGALMCGVPVRAPATQLRALHLVAALAFQKGSYSEPGLAPKVNLARQGTGPWGPLCVPLHTGSSTGGGSPTPTGHAQQTEGTQPAPNVDTAHQSPAPWCALVPGWPDVVRPHSTAAAFSPGPPDSARMSWALIQRPGACPKAWVPGWPRATLGESRKL